MTQQEIINLLEKTDKWITLNEITNSQNMPNEKSCYRALQNLIKQNLILRRERKTLTKYTIYEYKIK